ncbi:MAG: mannose-1-phosphate guanylyltransferase, partial [Bacteroidales bacterium]|nr:mannose-1-phosphate guanylyltransferase [Bacteroidales bacterium]
MNHIVIMAGGVGSRFWPLSTPEYPKQFIDILGCGRSLIQLTVDRFQGICPPENFWVVTNAAYVDTVRFQLPDVPAGHILAEPAARNTAPCIAWACWSIRREDPSANVVVTPADAVVMDVTEFRRVIGNALAFTASRAAIVTIGINPTRPETGYGYIEAGGLVSGEIQAVRAFKEKPSLDVAKGYLAAGNFLWNAGIFVWNVETIVACISRYKPGIAADMDRIMASGDVEGIFPSCEKISIDFAVMEPASLDGLVYTHPASFGWSDLG